MEIPFGVLESVIGAISGAIAGGIISNRIAESKMAKKHRWDKYSNAEKWCDELIGLIKEMQANYRYKEIILNSEEYGAYTEIPGKDLDSYGSEILEHNARRPDKIFNVIGEEGEEGISDRVGRLVHYCGLFSDSNLQSMGKEGRSMLVEESDEFQAVGDELVENIVELRNIHLQNDFRE